MDNTPRSDEHEYDEHIQVTGADWSPFNAITGEEVAYAHVDLFIASSESIILIQFSEENSEGYDSSCSLDIKEAESLASRLTMKAQGAGGDVEPFDALSKGAMGKVAAEIRLATTLAKRYREGDKMGEEFLKYIKSLEYPLELFQEPQVSKDI